MIAGALHDDLFPIFTESACTHVANAATSRAARGAGAATVDDPDTMQRRKIKPHLDVDPK